MSNAKVGGVKRVINAFGYSMKGLKAAFKHEAAFRQELLITLIAFPAAYWLADSWLEGLLLMSVIWLILIVELINSAIEAVVDRISDEHHELSGRAKDIGSGAVLLSFILAIATWLIVSLC